MFFLPKTTENFLFFSTELEVVLSTFIYTFAFSKGLSVIVAQSCCDTRTTGCFCSRYWMSFAEFHCTLIVSTSSVGQHNDSIIMLAVRFAQHAAVCAARCEDKVLAQRLKQTALFLFYPIHLLVSVRFQFGSKAASLGFG